MNQIESLKAKLSFMNINKLQGLIDGKKMTKAKVIKATGISRPALDAILEGNDFKVSNLEKIANALNVKVGYFFDEEIAIRTAGRDYVEQGEIVHNGAENNGEGTLVVGDAVLAERVKSLETLIAEKDARIDELKERIEELKSK